MAAPSSSTSNLAQGQHAYESSRDGNATPSTSKFTVGSPPSATSGNGGNGIGGSTIKSGRRKVATKPAWANDSDEDIHFLSYSRPTSPTETQGRPSVAVPPSISSVAQSHPTPQSPDHEQTSRPSTSSSSLPLSPTTPRPPPPAHRKESDQSTASATWWTFTMPAKYKRRAEEYLRKFGEGADDKDEDESDEDRERRDGLGDLEQGKRGSGWKPGMPLSDEDDRMRMEARISTSVFSSNHATTPGWSSPWVPFRRLTDHNPFGSSLASPDGAIPLTGTIEKEGLERKTPGHLTGDTSHYIRDLLNRRTIKKKVVDFLLHSVFAPLFFRLLNLSFTACVLGLAIRVLVVENQHNIRGIIGTSTTLALIIAPLTLCHILGSVYLEYFGRPIGIWSVRLKMTHTLIDLVFIVLWSSELSLAFDDYFSTSLECTTWTPNPRFQSTATVDVEVPTHVQDILCDSQGALVALVFGGMVLYIAVLVVSLFRIFNQVRRKN
ncbi:hypothetical protein BT69DRAFT_1338355 [Atractiella rhizophila]|nr:hypothetical protein BT69DRAFT_1338355 [Atractiella rhizophila]